MIRYRPFRNGDPPDLARLWNATVPGRGAVRPIRAHELDDRAFNLPVFDRAGLIVAELDGRAVGFVHAGFGPELPVEASRPLDPSPEMGTIAMLAVEPGIPGELDAARALILEAERYLRSRGAKVLYAGGQFPLNPFYWGIYAGPECSGFLSSHPIVAQALAAMGYEPISTAVCFEYDLGVPDRRDPRAVLIRRQAELEIVEDVLASNWWEELAIGEFHLSRATLRARADGELLARAATWDMSLFGRGDGRSRLGLIDVHVPERQRRKGYGRHLVSEVLRWAREFGVQAVEVQTPTTNEPALELYQSLGFVPVDQSVVYRLPAPLLGRSALP
ncbi:putative acetyltransferase [Aquisphaera giovannonii]|uniref:Putative acetyltransferase n=1 Tax=Aquisphaera giovannonii TaxID=406548 RepID=A0A5B9W382_9BACT|nr:GNAT family N-acetyltransferase [Aquisphaera giovannonii]QEH34709.1 putative acetyltransferase [Aquisphaera giovannonii]